MNWIIHNFNNYTYLLYIHLLYIYKKNSISNCTKKEKKNWKTNDIVLSMYLFVHLFILSKYLFSSFCFDFPFRSNLNSNLPIRFLSPRFWLSSEKRSSNNIIRGGGVSDPVTSKSVVLHMLDLWFGKLELNSPYLLAPVINKTVLVFIKRILTLAPI